MRLTIVSLLLSFVLLSGASSAIAKESKTASQKQMVLVHLSNYTSNLHAAFMAVKLGTKILEKGARVTIFTDLEGVRLADKSQPQNLTWGPSKDPMSKHYANFVKSGGSIAVCPHCAKAAGLNKSGLRNGAHIATKDELGDLFLKADKILDY